MARREGDAEVDCAKVRAVLTECQLTMMAALALGGDDKLNLTEGVLRRMTGGTGQNEHATTDINSQNVGIFEKWAQRRLRGRTISVAHDPAEGEVGDDEFENIERDPEHTRQYCENKWIITSGRLDLMISSARSNLYSINNSLEDKKFKSSLSAPADYYAQVDKQTLEDVTAFRKLHAIVKSYERQRSELSKEVWDFNDHAFPLTDSFYIYVTTLGWGPLLDDNYNDEEREEDKKEAGIWRDKLAALHKTYKVPLNKNLTNSEIHWGDLNKMAAELLVKLKRLMRTLESLQSEVWVMNQAIPVDKA